MDDFKTIGSLASPVLVGGATTDYLPISLAREPAVYDSFAKFATIYYSRIQPHYHHPGDVLPVVLARRYDLVLIHCMANQWLLASTTSGASIFGRWTLY